MAYESKDARNRSQVYKEGGEVSPSVGNVPSPPRPKAPPRITKKKGGKV